MNNYELLKNDKELNNIINSINEVNKNNLFACHGRYHTDFVINMIENLLSDLGFDWHIIELGKIAGLLHDIGTIKGKKGHAYLSSKMSVHFLNKTTLTKEDKDIIIHAIEDHSEGNNINSPVGASLLLADKIDISKDRVLELGKKDDWHRNLLNIEQVILSFENNNIIINYIVKDTFSEELLFSKYKKGIIIPVKACKYFNCDCIFKFNGSTVDLSKYY